MENTQSKKQKQHRTIIKKIRLTPEENSVLTQRATKAQMNFSGFARTRLFLQVDDNRRQQMVLAHRLYETIKQHETTLARIANNVNQIARVLNTVSVIDENVEQYLKNFLVPAIQELNKNIWGVKNLEDRVSRNVRKYNI